MRLQAVGAVNEVGGVKRLHVCCCVSCMTIMAKFDVVQLINLVRENPILRDSRIDQYKLAEHKPMGGHRIEVEL